MCRNFNVMLLIVFFFFALNKNEKFSGWCHFLFFFAEDQKWFCCSWQGPPAVVANAKRLPCCLYFSLRQVAQITNCSIEFQSTFKMFSHCCKIILVVFLFGGLPFSGSRRSFFYCHFVFYGQYPKSSHINCDFFQYKNI